LTVQTNNNAVGEIAGIMLGIPSGQGATIDSITRTGGVTDLRFWTTPVSNPITSNMTMFLNGASNTVGIGTSTPTERLQVSGKIYSDTQILNNSNDSATVPSFSFKENSNTGMFHAADNTVGFTTGGTERLRVDSSGNVGIGTSSPGFRLDVVGNTRLNNAVIGDAGFGGDWAVFAHSNVFGATNYALLCSSAGATLLNAATTRDIRFRLGNSEHVLLNTTGFGIGTTSPSTKLHVSGDILASGNVTAYSDIRAKSNLGVITEPLSKVSQLTGYTYEMIDNPDLTTKITPRFTGIIAQELEKVLPEAVHKHNDGKYSVAYGNMAGLFVESIKELIKENTELKTKVSSLEERLEVLERLIGSV
jgi:hypothetical protein